MNKRSKSRLLRYTTSTAIHHLYAFTLISCNRLFICTVVASLKNLQAFEQQQFPCRYRLTHVQLLLTPQLPAEWAGNWLQALA
ncbi:hypothetical protein N1078_10765 [Pseudomonas sp. MIL19]|uniref:hypothetical protein n=1 Tax=Pseudomonas sp. MIL19 TaxID=2976979 RepID=UPI002364484B|nr:hypothetical protein [Pseudomonas sp. MIL19]MDD2161059.1 hypothetical protein [Pseudomonas sp. MIL19]